jgi:hypothetical protein
MPEELNPIASNGETVQQEVRIKKYSFKKGYIPDDPTYNQFGWPIQCKCNGFGPPNPGVNPCC